MRTKSERLAIINSFSEPISLENWLSQDEINILIDEFHNSKEKIHKNTGPITVNIDFNKEPFKSLLDRLRIAIGDAEVTAGFFFYTETPHVIHNDDTFELPQVFKGITIPLEYKGGTKHPYLCFFHQYYLEGPAKFFNGGCDYPVHYNKHVFDYSQVENTSEKEFPEIIHKMYLGHIKDEWLKGLSFDRALPWKPGNVLIFDSVQLHCASNFIKQGITSKLGISIFTKLSGGVVDEK